MSIIQPGSTDGGADGGDRGTQDVIPPHTLRVWQEKLKDFESRLGTQATANMLARGSQVPTDTDVADAYRSLTRPSNTSRFQRCVGDAALIGGGTLLSLPLNGFPWGLALVGVFVCGLGFYIREFLRAD